MSNQNLTLTNPGHIDMHHCGGPKNCHEMLRTIDLDDPNCKDCLDGVVVDYRECDDPNPLIIIHD